MKLNNHALPLILIVFLFLCPSILKANGKPDSLSMLMSQPIHEVHSLYLPTINGNHPSQYQFVIQAPTEAQIQAWLDGDFDQLQHSFSKDNILNGGKGQFFANAQGAVSNARTAIAKVEEIGNFISQFDGSSLAKLPIGMKKTLNDGTQFEIVIDRIHLYPTHAEIAVYAKVKTPKMLDALYFGSPDIHFSRKAGIKAGSLGLLGKTTTRIFEDVALLEFQGAVVEDDAFVPGVGTYVKFDCDGLSEFNLDADLIFNRDVIRPAYPDPQNPDAPIRAELDVSIGNSPLDGLNDILVAIDLSEPFVSPKKEDLIFTASQIIFDFSESRHHSGLFFPVADYTPDLPDIALWQGVYIEEFTVQLPDQIFSGANSSPEQFSVYDLIIDQTGFTGFLHITPVFSINEGQVGGWPFSVDDLTVHFYQNDLAGFEFGGLVGIPLLNNDPNGAPNETSALEYYASFDWLNDMYAFSAATTEAQTFQSKMLHANITIDPNSSLEFTFGGDNNVEVVATLYGSLSINAPFSNESSSNAVQVQVPEVTFENLVVANQGTFIRNTGNWNVMSIEVSVNNFTLTVSNIGMSGGDSPDEVFLNFMAKLNIGSNPVDISAEGAFRIAGNIEMMPDGKQNWVYDRFILDALFIDVETEAFDFSGHIIFFDDIPQFGSGFQGKLSLEIKALGGVGLEAMGIFGNTSDYRYFLVDVMAKFPSGMITIGYMDVRGFGGGVYVNMSQQSITQSFEGAPEGSQIPDYHAGSSTNDFNAYKAAIAGRLGQSLSGIQYLPDNTVPLGVKAGIVIATPAEEVFNANVAFFIEFHSGGGLAKVGMSGYANIMAPISWNSPACEGISIRFNMEYETPQGSDDGHGRFTAQALAFVNLGEALRGGFAPPSGVNELNAAYNGAECEQLFYAGGMDILFSADDWHIFIGVPEYEPDSGYDPPFPWSPIELNVYNTLRIKTYMDIGTNVPPFPGLPANVAELTGLGNIVQNESDRATGDAFAFGSRIVVDNNMSAWGIVSAHLTLDVGFDIMLRRYQEAVCVNNNNQELGINGWYAAGQAWAFVEGGVSVLGFEILEAALAAAIQIKGPNPFYGRGAIAGRYSVLGGLKKGQFRFPLEFGEECELEDGGSIVLDIPIISGILPIDGAADIPVETKPVIEFAYPVNEVVGLETDGLETYYMIQLDEYEVQNENGTVVDGQWIWNEDNYSIEFLPEDMLDANATYVILATASLYQANADGSIIGSAIDLDTRAHTFVTGASIDYVPVSNIEAAWPANGQFNYYQGENEPNFIRLERGQDYLFSSSGPDAASPTSSGDDTPSLPVPGATEKIIRISNQDEEFEVPYSYSFAQNTISYDLPTLTAGGAYKAELLFNEEAEQVLYTFYFRVSRANTFVEKMAQTNWTNLAESDPSQRVYFSQISNLPEPFGIEELIGLDQLGGPTLSVEADLDNTPWAQQFRALDIPIEGTLDLYDLDQYCDFQEGIPNYYLTEFELYRSELKPTPVDAVAIFQDNTTLCVVTSDNYMTLHSNRQSNMPVAEVSPAQVAYALPKVIKYDYNNLQLQANSPEVYEALGGLWTQKCIECGYGSYCNLVQCCEDDNPATISPAGTLLDMVNSTYANNPCFRMFYSKGTITNPCEYQQYWNVFEERELTVDLFNSTYPIKPIYTFPTGGKTNSYHSLYYVGQ